MGLARGTRGRDSTARWGPTEALAALSRTMPPVRGKPNLAWRLMRRAERSGSLDGTWRVRLTDGTRLELPRQSRMTWAVAFTGRYDHAVVARVAEYIEPGTVALDVGASVGLWTVQLGKIAASRGALVWAFEPNPANTAWIRRNIALNDLSGTVTVCEMGLGDTAESLILVGSEYGVGNGAIELDPQAGTEKHPRIPITLGRLDDVELPARVSFVKIDVEGYEAAFLRGAAELIERDRPVIFGEFAAQWLERRGENLRRTLGQLVDQGYEVMALTRPRPKQAWRAAEVVQPHPVDPESSEPLPDNLLLRHRDHRAGPPGR
jgi:FkbM family methyltransferase